MGFKTLNFSFICFMENGDKFESLRRERKDNSWYLGD